MEEIPWKFLFRLREIQKKFKGPEQNGVFCMMFIHCYKVFIPLYKKKEKEICLKNTQRYYTSKLIF